MNPWSNFSRPHRHDNNDLEAQNTTDWNFSTNLAHPARVRTNTGTGMPLRHPVIGLPDEGLDTTESAPPPSYEDLFNDSGTTVNPSQAEASRRDSTIDNADRTRRGNENVTRPEASHREGHSNRSRRENRPKYRLAPQTPIQPPEPRRKCHCPCGTILALIFIGSPMTYASYRGFKAM